MLFYLNSLINIIRINIFFNIYLYTYLGILLVKETKRLIKPKISY